MHIFMRKIKNKGAPGARSRETRGTTMSDGRSGLEVLEVMRPGLFIGRVFGAV